MITAERAIIRAALTVMGPPRDYQINLPWIEEKKESYGRHSKSMAHSEQVKYGKTLITYRHRINPHTNHIGDFFMEDLGSYKDIHSVLHRLISDGSTINAEKEKQLAQWMLRFCNSGKPISLSELQQLNDTSDRSALNKVRQIFYHCFVKEPASWMIPAEKSHELPLLTSQLRAVQLIAAGYLYISDVFNLNAKYGVFTGENIGKNIDELTTKIARINRLYTKKLILSKDDNRAKYFSFTREHPAVVAISTREQLHQELQKNLGAASDSDGEGYDSDTAEERYPGVYRF